MCRVLMFHTHTHTFLTEIRHHCLLIFGFIKETFLGVCWYEEECACVWFCKCNNFNGESCAWNGVGKGGLTNLTVASWGNHLFHEKGNIFPVLLLMLLLFSRTTELMLKDLLSFLILPWYTHVACRLKEIKTIVMWDIRIEWNWRLSFLSKNILIINFGDNFNIAAVIGNMKHYLNRKGTKKAKTFYTIIHTKPFRQNLFQQLLSTIHSLCSVFQLLL